MRVQTYGAGGEAALGGGGARDGEDGEGLHVVDVGGSVRGKMAR